MKTIRKIQRNKARNTFANKLSGFFVSGAALLGLLLPLTAQAAITDINGNNAQFTNGVANIYAQEKLGEHGLNRFTKFDVEQGQIANMHFKTAAEAAEFNTLLNFVKGSININGTVNAIKGGSIGGNLYFFSGGDQILIGKSGVINAGSLNLIMRANDANMWDKDKWNAENKAAFLEKFEDELANNSFAINSKGTITVKGKLNAGNEIRLMAGKSIAVEGKLTSGVSNFESMVNAVDDNGTKITDFAGPTGMTFNYDYAAGQDDTNDIILDVTAKEANSGSLADYSFIENETAKKVVSGTSEALLAKMLDYDTVKSKELKEQAEENVGDQLEDETDEKFQERIDTEYSKLKKEEAQKIIKNAYRDVQAEITIGKDAELTSNGGTISITATAEPEVGAAQLYGIAVGVLQNKASITIADGATIKATGADSAANGTDTSSESATDTVTTSTPTIKIQATAKVENDINVYKWTDPTAEDASAGDDTAGDDTGSGTGTGGTGTGTTDDSGTGTGTGGTTDDSTDTGSTDTATTDTDTSSSTGASEKSAIDKLKNSIKKKVKALEQSVDEKVLSAKDGLGKYVDIEAAVAVVNNSAEVSIGKANISAQTDDATDTDPRSVEIGALAELKQKSYATVQGNKDAEDGNTGTSATNFAVAVSALKNNAKISIAKDAGITADNIKLEGKSSVNVDTAARVNEVQTDTLTDTAVNVVDVDADATVTIDGKLNAKKDITVKAGNLSEMKVVADNAYMETGTDGDNDGDATDSSSTSKKSGTTTTAADSDDDSDATDDSTGTGLAIGKTITGAASVASITANYDAKLTIGENAALQGGNDVTLQAITTSTDVLATVNSNASTQTDGSNSNVEAAAAVLYDNLNYNANIIIESPVDAANNTISAGKNLNINAESNFINARVSEKYEEIPSLQDVKNLVPKSFTLADGVKSAKNAMSMYKDLQDLKRTSGADIANFAASSTSRAVAKDEDSTEATTPAAYSAAGSVTINNLSNKANVVVGMDRKLESGTKLTQAGESADMNITATTQQEYVALAGSVDWSALKGNVEQGADAGSVAIGGNVNVNLTESSSAVVLAENVNLNAKNINVASESKGNAYSFAVGGGASDKYGFSGMTNIVVADNHALALVDDEAQFSSDKLALTAKNDLGATLVAMDINKTAKVGVGAGVNVAVLDRDAVAGIVDVDRDDTIANSKQLVSRTGKNVSGLTAQLVKQIGTDAVKYMGSTDNNVTKQSFDFKALEVTSTTDGSVHSLAVAAGEDKKTTDADKSKNSGASIAQEQLDEAQQDVADDEDAGADDAAEQDAEAEEADSTEDVTDAEENAEEASGGAKSKSNKLKLDVIGSVAVNSLGSNTASLVEDSTFASADKDNSAVKLSAEDGTFLGAYAGAGAFQALQDENSADYAASLAGAAAINDNSSNVIATAENSTVNNYAAFSNTAVKNGAQVAAGAALGSQGEAKGFNVTAGYSQNYADNTVAATLKNVNMDNISKLVNVAADSDMQIAGAATAAKTQANAGIGASIVYQNLKNTISSTISGAGDRGVYTNIGSMDVYSASRMTQIGGALSAGLKNSDKTGAQLNAAVALNNITNNVVGAITGANITADALNLKAGDGSVLKQAAESTDERETTEQVLENKHKTQLQDEGFDVEGEVAENTAKQSKKQDVVAADNADDTNEVTENTGLEITTDDTYTFTQQGNKIITVAAGLALSKGSDAGVSAGAATAVTRLTSNHSAEVKNSTINITDTAVDASSDSKVINVAAGASANTATSGANLAGSAGFVSEKSTTGAQIIDSAIANNVAVNAKNNAALYTVSGELSYSTTTAAVGLVTANNLLQNTTSAVMQNVTNANATDVGKATATATNTSSNYAIAGGLSASAGSNKVAAVADVAGNVGSNSTIAYIGGKANEKLSLNGGDISVKANDATTTKAIAGQVNAALGSTVAGSGAAAYNSIGTEHNKQQVLAELANVDVNGANVAVEALNKSALTTAAAGITAGTAKVAANGSVAVAKVNSTTGAYVKNASVSDASEDLKIHAENETKILTIAGAAGLSVNSTVTGSAAVAVNTINAHTEAKADTIASDAEVKALTIKAKNNAEIFNVTAGLAGSVNGTATISGNVGLNTIGSQTIAGLYNAAGLKVNDKLEVLADSKEIIKNFTGGISVGLNASGSGAASVAVNTISGDTLAEVKQSSVTMAAQKDINVKATSTHELANLVVAGGIAAGSTAVDVAGTGAQSTITGKTVALVDTTDIDAAGDVNVIAEDATTAKNIVGNGAVAAGSTGIAAGVAVDSMTIDRTTQAAVTGKSDVARNSITAQKLAVQATSSNTLKNMDIGVQLGAGSTGVAGVGLVTVNNIKANTDAIVRNMDAVTSAGFTIAAQHTTEQAITANAGSISAGEIAAAATIGVSVLNDTSKTNAQLENSAMHHTGTNAVDAVTATNNVTNTNKLGAYSAALGLGGNAAVGVGINNVDAEAVVSVANAEIGQEEAVNNYQAAQKVTLQALNDFNLQQTDATAGAGLASVTANVAVNNPNSAANVIVANSKVNAATIDVEAKEERKLTTELLSGDFGGLAVGGNVAVNVIGGAVQDSYGYTNREQNRTDSALQQSDNAKQQEDSAKAEQQAASDASALDKIASKAQSSQVGEIKATLNAKQDAIKGIVQKFSTATTAAATKNVVGADSVKSAVKGITDANKTVQEVTGVSIRSVAKTVGVDLSITGSELSASDTLNIKSISENKISSQLTNATGAVGGANAAVNVTNVYSRTNLTLDNATLQAKKLSVEALQSGTAESSVTAYGGAVAKAGAAYAGLHNEANTNIVVKNASSLASNADALSIMAADTMQYTATAGSKGGAVGNAAVLIADAMDTGNVGISIGDTNTFIASSNVTLAAQKAGSITTKVENYNGSLEGVNVGVALAEGAGTTSVTMGTGNTIKSGNDSTDGTIDVAANNLTNLEANAKIVAGSGADIGVSVARAYQGSNTAFKLASGNAFSAADVHFRGGYSLEKNEDGEIVVTAPTIKAVSNPGNIGVAANINVNVAKASLVGNTSMDIGSQTYAADTVRMDGENIAEVSAEIASIEGGLLNSGTNYADTRTRVTNTLTAHGAAYATKHAEVDDGTQGISLWVDNAIKTTLTGSAGSGSLAEISPAALRLKNISDVKGVINLDGAWNVGGYLDAFVTNVDNTTLTGTSTKGTGVGYSAGHLTNDVNYDAQVNVAGTIKNNGADKQALDDSRYFGAENQVTENASLTNRLYGAVAVQNAYYNDYANYKTAVNLKNATVESDNGDVKVAALTSGTLEHKNSIGMAGGGTSAMANSDFKITVANSITADGSTLKTTATGNDVTMAAYDNLTVKLDTIADNKGGLAGVSTTDVKSVFGHSNSVAVGQGTTVEAADNVNLYAGEDVQQGETTFNYRVTSDVYNKNLIPLWSDPALSNTMTQTNRVQVEGAIISIADTNIEAVAGLSTIAATSEVHKLYDSGSDGSQISVAAPGQTNKQEKATNEVIVNGSITAGRNNTLELTISGDPVSDGTNAEGSTKYKFDSDSITVTKNSAADWFDESTVTVSTYKTQNPYLDRYEELRKLLFGTAENSAQVQTYAPGTAEYTLLYNEYTSICEAMYNAGFAEKDGDNYTVLSERDQAVINLPELNLSGGNVNIKGTTVSGASTAAITAKGAPIISITSASTAGLLVNDITIGKSGGKVQFNQADMTEAANRGNYQGQVTSSYKDGEVPQITVRSTADPDRTHGFTADIIANGNLKNVEGDIKLVSDKSSIYQNKNADVTARNITIEAPNGDVVQTSSGLILIGGDPVTKYQINATVAKQIQAWLAANKANTTVSYTTYAEYLKNVVQPATGMSDAEITKLEEQYNAQSSAGRIQAARNVIITAKNVNIDGLIQSGYNTYTGTVVTDTDADAKMDALLKEYRKKNDNNTKTLTLDDLKAAGTKYVISQTVQLDNGSTAAGGAVYNANTKCYEYHVPVYYNPSTDEIVVDSITTGGGNIYIKGAISSTGNGRIVAASGAADVTIDTSASKRNVNLGEITVNNAPGRITLVDTNKQTADGKQITQVITNENSKTLVTNYVGTDAQDTEEYTDAYQYQPAENMTLKWTGSVVGQTTVTTKTYTKDFYAWGIFKGSDSDIYTEAASNSGKVTTYSSTSTDSTAQLPNGMVFVQDSSLGNNVYTADTKKNSGDAQKSKVNRDKKYDAWYSPNGKYIFTWTETTLNDTGTTYTVKANSPIDVGFASGSGNISVTAGGAIRLNDDITTARTSGTDAVSGIGSVSLTAGTNGGGGISHDEGVTVKADSFSFRAKGGDIDILHSAIGTKEVTGSIVTTGSSTDATGNTYSDNITFKSTAGNVNFTLASATGDISLSTSGNLKSLNSNGVNGKRITLNSEAGEIDANVKSIGTVDSENIISATAAKDVYLNNVAKSDMRIGQITSKNGTVSLTSLDGSIVDALQQSNLSGSEERLAKWKAQGIISQNATETSDDAATLGQENKASYLKDAQDRLLAVGGETKMAQYEQAASLLKDTSDASVTAAKAAYEKELTEIAGRALSDSEKLAATQEALQTYTEALQQFLASNGYSNFSSNEVQLVADYAAVQRTDASAYSWGVNELLYAVQSDIINSTPGEVVSVDKANIVANSIRLVSAGVGVDADAVTIKAEDVNKLENMKLLAQSKGGDLTWSADKSEVTIRRQNPVTVQMGENGKLVLRNYSQTGSGNLYLAGVNGTSLYLNDSIQAYDKDVKLMADKGITMRASAVISGKNLMLYGGSGDIGSAVYPMHINMTGTLDANTDMEHGIYIVDNGTLDIQNVIGKTISLTAKSGIRMSTETGKDMGHVEGNEVTLKSNSGGIGTQTTPIRLQNNAYNNNLMNLSVETVFEGVYLKGEGDVNSTINIVNAKNYSGNDFALNTSTSVTGGNIDFENSVLVHADGSISLNNIKSRNVELSTGREDSYVLLTNSIIGSQLKVKSNDIDLINVKANVPSSNKRFAVYLSNLAGGFDLANTDIDIYNGTNGFALYLGDNMKEPLLLPGPRLQLQRDTFDLGINERFSSMDEEYFNYYDTVEGFDDVYLDDLSDDEDMQEDIVKASTNADNRVTADIKLDKDTLREANLAGGNISLL